MQYVDGFLLVVPRRSLNAYVRMAKLAGKVWMQYGALGYRECVGDDLRAQMGIAFPKLAKLKPREAVVFSWIIYKSKAHRNRVNARVMKDERIVKMMSEPMPMDMKRFSYGGFKTVVSY